MATSWEKRRVLRLLATGIAAAAMMVALVATFRDINGPWVATLVCGLSSVATVAARRARRFGGCAP